MGKTIGQILQETLHESGQDCTEDFLQVVEKILKSSNHDTADKYAALSAMRDMLVQLITVLEMGEITDTRLYDTYIAERTYLNVICNMLHLCACNKKEED